MSGTHLSSVALTHPQERNVHGKAFGGYLMREAFELAFATAFSYTGQVPTFVALDDVAFIAPVPIGSLLQLRASVEYARGAPHHTLVVAVTAHATSVSNDHADGAAADGSGSKALPPPAGSAGGPTGAHATRSRLSNTYHFVLRVDGEPPLPVVPGSYSEAMRYIEAHRRSVFGRQLALARASRGCGDAEEPGAAPSDDGAGSGAAPAGVSGASAGSRGSRSSSGYQDGARLRLPFG